MPAMLRRAARALARAGFPLAALLAATFASATTLRAQGTIDADDARALRALARELDDRWNARDAEGFARLFAPDADLQVIGDAAARRIRGTVQRDYAATFARADRTLRHRTEVDELQPIGEGLVFVEGRAYIERANADGTVAVLRAYTVQNVVVRTREGWRLRVVRSHAEPLDAAVVKER